MLYRIGLHRRAILRWRVLLVATIVVAGVALTVGTVNLFVRPAVTPPRRSDAVVILGPGLHGERLREGMRLMKEGFGRVLVISEARRRDWTAGSRLCSGGASFPIVCFRAMPYTTRGEARQVAALGTQHHWSSFLVVTSTYHVTRARLLYNRCIPGKVDVIGADPKASRLEWMVRIVHEWGGVADARFATRGC